MMRWIWRLGYGLLFAVPLMMLTYAIAQAGEFPQAEAPGDLDCPACHEVFHDAWQDGAHGQALSNPEFAKAWQATGQAEECLQCHVTGYDPVLNTWETDGVSCKACHSPIPENHPLEPMTTDRTGKVCSDCHTETHFEWQVSAHASQGLDCSSCHDPHATSLKAEDSQELCASCHQGRSENFAHSRHSEEGLFCADCHLSQLVESGEGGHSKRDHSFFVTLASCNQCHVYQMHDPVEVHTDRTPPEEAVDAMASVEALSASTAPLPVSPAGFTVLAGLIGVAFGIIIAPSIERFQHRNRDEEE